jgi:TatD DNase family protein
MNGFINIHTHSKIAGEDKTVIFNYLIKDNHSSLQLQPFSSIGLHPWHITDNNESLLEVVEKNATKNNVFAIGEIGLDRACNIPFEQQKSIFEKQIDIAGKVQKPVIIHCVKAYPDIISVKKQTNSQVAWIIHGFNGNLQIARQLLEHKCFLSFGEFLLKSHKVQEVFKQIPLEKIFFETDQATIRINQVYEKAANLLAISVTTLQKQIQTNFFTLKQ